MDTIPCKNCLVLPICKGRTLDSGTVISGSNQKEVRITCDVICSILYEWADSFVDKRTIVYPAISKTFKYKDKRKIDVFVIKRPCDA